MLVYRTTFGMCGRPRVAPPTPCRGRHDRPSSVGWELVVLGPCAQLACARPARGVRGTCRGSPWRADQPIGQALDTRKSLDGAQEPAGQLVDLLTDLPTRRCGTGETQRNAGDGQ